MAELLFESPFTIGITGLAFVLIALITWINGGFKWALYVAIGLAVLTAILVVINITVKTDRELITAELHDVAEAVQHNDLAKVLTYIHPSAVEGVLRVKAELPHYRFSEVRITGIKSVQVNRRSQPPSAIAEFNVAVSLRGNGSQASGIRRFVRCFFLQREGRWLVNDYQHFDVSAGFREDVQ